MLGPTMKSAEVLQRLRDIPISIVFRDILPRVNLSMSTVANLYYGRIKSPSARSIEILADYFEDIDAKVERLQRKRVHTLAGRPRLQKLQGGSGSAAEK
jgi:hypothetical protein